MTGRESLMDALVEAAGGVLMPSWHAVVNERGADGKRHFWNINIDADDARDAAAQAATGYDPERVDGIEVERSGTDYTYGH